jgi:membrane-anchored mycosin MYCP
LLVRPARAAVLTLVLGSVPLVLGVAPARAADVPDCTQTSDSDVSQLSHQRSKPLDLLGIDEAQRVASARGGLPGSGVTVAVVDSGIAPHDQVTLAAQHSVRPGGSVVRPVDYHGTAVAGLIAGRSRPGGEPVGIAPGARVVDVQVYGWAKGTSGQPSQADRADLVAGLDWLAQQASALHVDIAVVPMAVAPDATLAAAVRRLQARGVLVIAPSGNRPDPSDTGNPLAAYATDRPGQDGFADIGPANAPGVLVAGTTAAGSTPAENPGSIPNHAVDVVVPTAGGISLALNGGTCVLTAPATSWAAAEVGGIAALLLQRYAGESPSRIAARIIDTASGTTAEGPAGASAAETSRYFGAGVAQPVDALTRPLTASGPAFSSLRATPEQTPPVRPPVEEADVLHHSRRVAIWAGLIGAGIVVAASILRPLLSRRSGG